MLEEDYGVSDFDQMGIVVDWVDACRKGDLATLAGGSDSARPARTARRPTPLFARREATELPPCTAGAGSSPLGCSSPRRPQSRAQIVTLQ